jgi:hypothetical protein
LRGAGGAFLGGGNLGDPRSTFGEASITVTEGPDADVGGGGGEFGGGPRGASEGKLLEGGTDAL